MDLSVETARRGSVDVLSAFALDVAKWLRLSAIIFMGERIQPTWKIAVLIVIESGMRLRNDIL
jgi:hypothetical protein